MKKGINASGEPNEGRGPGVMFPPHARASALPTLLSLKMTAGAFQQKGHLGNSQGLEVRHLQSTVT